MEDNTWAQVDMEYLFECSTCYLMSEYSKQATCKVVHEKRYSISTSNNVVFCLLYRQTDNEVLYIFPKATC